MTRTATATLCLLIAIHVLRDRFQGLSLDATFAHVAGVSLPTVLLGILLTAVSYAAIASYDVLAFGLIGRRLPPRDLLRSGVAATGLGQALGFGLVVGSFVRWRILRDQRVTPKDAAAASALVTSGFLLGLAVVFAVMTLLASHSVSAMAGVSQVEVIAAGLAVLAIYALLLSTRGIELSLFGRKVFLPSRKLMLRQTLLAALDVLPAGLALWVLLPAGVEASLGIVLIAYIAALGAGLLSNTPGGIGAFEGVFLIALPEAPVDSLLAGIICFRLIYFGLPFCLALLLLTDAELGTGRTRPLAAAFRQAWRPTTKWRSVVRQSRTIDPALPPSATLDSSRIAQAITKSHRAEANLAFLGDKRFVLSQHADGFVMYGQSGRTLVAMGDPVAPQSSWPELIERFRRHAVELGSYDAVLYKIGPDAATICRAQGLRTDCIGHEAVLDLKTFNLAGSERRDLRRKARQAEKAGVEIQQHAPGQAPLQGLAEVARIWREGKRGRERSFSTGHFEPDYIARFPVFEARHNGSCCAFISLWVSGDGSEWALDLMRNRADVPAGTMHALVLAAAMAAKASGALRFNLCMAPLSGLEESTSRVESIGHAVFRRGARFHGLQGLRQFKSSFRPDWEPRYLARRPGPALIGAAVAAYRLCRKGPDEPQTAGTQPPLQSAHLSAYCGKAEDGADSGGPAEACVEQARS